MRRHVNIEREKIPHVTVLLHETPTLSPRGSVPKADGCDTGWRLKMAHAWPTGCEGLPAERWAYGKPLHIHALSLSLSVALCPPSPQTSTSVHVSASAEEKTTPETRGILATTSADATTTATLAANNVPTAAATAATADASAAANAFTAIPYSAPLHPQTLLATDTLHNRVFFPSSCSSALPPSRFHLKGS